MVVEACGCYYTSGGGAVETRMAPAVRSYGDIDVPA
jgi:hypothetical protein